MTDATKASEVAERLEAKAEQHRFAASQSSLGDGSPYKDAAELFEAAASLIRALNERVERLEGALSGLVDDINGLIEESDGVYGLHLNGDPSPWSELVEGGRFERLTHLSIATAALERK